MGSILGQVMPNTVKTVHPVFGVGFSGAILFLLTNPSRDGSNSENNFFFTLPFEHSHVPNNEGLMVSTCHIEILTNFDLGFGSFDWV